MQDEADKGIKTRNLENPAMWENKKSRVHRQIFTNRMQSNQTTTGATAPLEVWRSVGEQKKTESRPSSKPLNSQAWARRDLLQGWLSQRLLKTARSQPKPPLASPLDCRMISLEQEVKLRSTSVRDLPTRPMVTAEPDLDSLLVNSVFSLKLRLPPSKTSGAE
jgi:hypothetical protein